MDFPCCNPRNLLTSQQDEARTQSDLQADGCICNLIIPASNELCQQQTLQPHLGSRLLKGQGEACGFSMHAFPLSANSSRIYLRSGTFMNSYLTNFLLEVDEFAFRLQFGMTELRLEALQFINLNGVHTLHTPVHFHLLSLFCR